MAMEEKQRKQIVIGGFVILTVIVLYMLVHSLLHLNRYWLCAKPEYRSLHLCIYEFPVD